MKKIFCLLLALVMTLGLCACSADIFTSKKTMYAEAEQIFYSEENYSLAFEKLGQKKLAAYGPAQLLLGDLYKEGRGVHQDYVKAAQLYSAAVEQGVALAKYELAELYHKGLGVDADKAKAVELYGQFVIEAEAALSEPTLYDARVYYALACCYGNGYGVSADADKTAEYLEKMLKCETVGTFLLCEAADNYMYGGFVPVNEDAADELYRKAYEKLRVFAENGDMYAQVTLGKFYESGLCGLEKDEAAAREWFEKAAEQGEAYALAVLHKWELYGEAEELYYVQEDYTAACGILSEEELEDYAPAQLLLADCYKEGRGIQQDYAEAARLYAAAAEQGVTLAWYEQGNMHLNGMGMNADSDKAIELFRRFVAEAESRNDEESLHSARRYYALALCWGNGLGVEADSVKATEYLEKTLQCETVGTFLLCEAADNYMYGGVVPVDREKAGELYAKALEKLTAHGENGEPEAQLRLAWFYENGPGANKKDYTKALEWYGKAAEQGNADAAAALEKLSLYREAANLYYVDEDYIGAGKLLQREILADYAPAQLLLGDNYDSGRGVIRDYNRAAELYAASADFGEALALCELAEMYLVGNGVARDREKAMELYGRFVTAAEDALGDDPLQDARIYCELVGCCANGRGTDIDIEKAGELMEKMLLCEPVGTFRMTYAAGCYMQGSYGPVDKAAGDELYEMAFDKVTALAESGDSYAQSVLGNYYESGLGKVEQDHDKAREWYEKSAEQDNSSGLGDLAGMYYYGIGVDADHVKTEELLLRAAEHNSPDAFKFLGTLYGQGQDIKDYNKSFKYTKTALDMDHASAYSNMAAHYLEGWGVEVDEAKAIELLKQSIERNQSHGHLWMGLCYREGRGVEQNYRKAVEHFTIAADRGETNGMMNLGCCYLYGQGVNVNYTKARELFEKCISHGGDRFVYSKMGDIYRDGLGVAQDYDTAVEWYEIGIAKNDMNARYGMGYMHFYGYGVSKDYRKAFDYFSAAAQDGHVYSMDWLGYMYRNGYGVARDYELAMAWYEKAYELGYAESAGHIGNMYELGQGTPQNYHKALMWYRRAADGGSSYAVHQIGWMHQNGLGTYRDYKRALEQYEKAAEMGNATSYFQLGYFYEHGMGVPIDYLKAGEYYLEAASRGHDSAFQQIFNERKIKDALVESGRLRID